MRALIACLLSCALQAQPTWLPPPTQLSLSIANQSAEVPCVAAAPDGTALALWTRYNGTNAVIEMAQCTNGVWNSWGAITPTGRGLDADEPRVVIDGAGNATAVWSHYVGFNKLIASARLPVGATAWQMLPDLTTGGNACEPQLVLGGNNAIAIWQRYNGSQSVVESATLAARAVAWSAATALPTAEGGDAFSPHMAVNSAGMALAAWTCYNGQSTTIQAAYRTATGWTALPQPYDTTQVDNDLPHVAIDAAGNGALLWLSDDGTQRTVKVAQLAGTPRTWSRTTQLTSDGKAGDPAIAMSPAGLVVAVWVRENGSQALVEASVLRRTTGWSPARPLTSAGKGSMPRLALDASGNGFAIWARTDGELSTVEAAHLTGATSQWSSPTQLSEAIANLNARDPTLALGPNDTAVAAWQRYNGTTNVIETRRYDALPPPPPAPQPTPQGEQQATLRLQKQNRRRTGAHRPAPPRSLLGHGRMRPSLRGHLTHKLFYLPSNDPSVIAYKLYCNGHLIATHKPSQTHTFTIGGRKARRCYRYTLTAVSLQGYSHPLHMKLGPLIP